MERVISDILAICAGVSLFTLSLGYLAIFWQLSRKPRSSVPFGISVLKPMKGLDDGLVENIRALLQQDHPDYEVIFGAEDPNDPALLVAAQVASKYPKVRTRIIPGSFASGLNPKVKILRHLLPWAAHEWILVSDSNVRPDPGYLRALCDRQRESGAHLVHSMLVGAGGKSMGGRFEELQLNGWVAASIALSSTLGHACVIGKSMLMHRSALAAVGGFGSVEDILAEDCILGAKFQRAGKTVAISPHLLSTIAGQGTMRHFVNRHVRWGQMRRRISPGFYFAELSANPTPFLLALASLEPNPEARVTLVVLLAKWLVDSLVFLRLSPTPHVVTLALIPIKDLLVPIMWVLGAVKRTVNWRGKLMLVGPGSRLSALGVETGSSSNATPWVPNPS